MRDSLPKHVAAEVRAEMSRQNVTPRQLAARLGVSEMWVSRRRRGLTEISLSELERIADALGVPVTRFLPAGELSDEAVTA